jgi:hypothetical protein
MMATITFGQANKGKASEVFLNKTKVLVADTALRVIHVDKNTLNQHPAYFINGQFIMNPSLSSTINPQNIDNINVVKRDTLINNVLYRGQLYIITKEGYSPRFITLTELKNKYTTLIGKPVIFMLDGNFITTDYETYMVDETNLLTIIIDNLQSVNEKMDIGLIKLLSKTEENIKARKQIMIRGADLTMKN